MKKPIRLFSSGSLLGALFVVLVSCQPNAASDTREKASENPEAKASARPVHWSYHVEDGPEKWAGLSPVYALCGEGNAQSPVSIPKVSQSGEVNWAFDYGNTSLRIAHNEHMDDIIDNGHTIQVTVDEGSTLSLQGKTYALKQFHFHTPSEHMVNGQHYPMEMHMVHQSDDESLAVVGVLFEEGNTANENFSMIIANLPNAKGESKHLKDTSLPLEVHIPKDLSIYHYTGSLTTPPCSEQVQWLVLRNPLSLTADQIREFSSRMGKNNRPVQALNARTVNLEDLDGNKPWEPLLKSS